MAACADQELLLGGLVDGELDAANTAMVEAHVAPSDARRSNGPSGSRSGPALPPKIDPEWPWPVSDPVFVAEWFGQDPGSEGFSPLRPYDPRLDARLRDEEVVVEIEVMHADRPTQLLEIKA